MDGIKKNIIFKPSGAASKLFVYGTLRKACGHPLHNILKDQFEFVARGSIRGILFDIGQYPGALISKHAKTEIVGEIYRVRDYPSGNSALKILDEYEGYDGSDLLGSEFIRKRMFVKIQNKKKLLCWVYIYNRSVINKHPIRSGDYIQRFQAKDLL
jgi:pyruvate carboxylase